MVGGGHAMRSGCSIAAGDPPKTHDNEAATPMLHSLRWPPTLENCGHCKHKLGDAGDLLLKHMRGKLRKKKKVTSNVTKLGSLCT